MTRVFVTGTGRCGTLTFAKACEHVHGFTAGHETRKGEQLLDPVYPDNHIEVDPHLVWILPDLLRRYPDAKWVILRRDRRSTIDSLARRETLDGWSRLAFNGVGVPPSEAAAMFVKFVLHFLERSISIHQSISLCTPVGLDGWHHFLKFIGAPIEGLVGATRTLAKVHNAGGPA